MSGMTSDLALVTRVRQKFEALENTCMARYTSREQRVITTLTYCVSTLEQLHAWAGFAIFPPDEQNSERYLAFVEQRFQCVMGPLRVFLHVAQGENGGHSSLEQPKGYLESVLSGNLSRDHGFSPREGRMSPRQGSDGSGSSRGEAMISPGRHGSGTPVPDSAPTGSLRDKVNTVSQRYVEEGRTIHDVVMNRIQRCRKDIRTIYRWGQASLLDLHDLMDDSLADELYFMVRGKMARVLSTIGVFEEAAEAVEKSFSSYFPHEDGKENSSRASSEQGDTDDQGGANPKTPNDLPTRDTSALRNVDLSEMRLALDELADTGSGFTPRVPSGENGEKGSSESTPGSTTPEPPTSPRPKGLVNHPKIMKDRLQSYALPSKFLHMRIPPLNGTW